AATIATSVASPGIVVKDEIPQCTTEGRFADPHDCGQFYDCLPDDNKGFVVQRQTCFGNAFHPDLKLCVPKEKLKNCFPDSKSGRRFEVADSSHQKLCRKETNQFLCADCKTLLTCVDGKPFTYECNDGTVCTQNTLNNVTTGICHNKKPKECTCEKAVTFKRDFYDPSKFLSCQDKSADPIILSCPEGLLFNEKRKACGIIPTSDKCSEEGGSCLILGTVGQHCPGDIKLIKQSAEDQCICCLPATCEQACDNGGQCLSPGVCLCSEGWSGPSCQQPICDPACLNGGECVAPNTCKCLAGYQGNNCEHCELNAFDITVII
ncbi:unnamed protein product, partial [Meganyctiphanes norvegica]